MYIEVVDSDATAQGTVDVGLGIPGGDVLTATLPAVAGDPGVFQGVVQTEAGSPNPADSVLQCAVDNVVNAGYNQDAATDTITAVAPQQPTTNTITGIVYGDSDGNGSKDTGESGFANADVYIDANNDEQFNEGTETKVVTDADGVYTLADLDDGTYIIRVVLFGGESLTQPSEGYYSIAASSGTTYDQKDFGITSDSGSSDEMVVLNEVVFDPQSDWHDPTGTKFDDQPGSGTVDYGSAYIELKNVSDTAIDVTGWHVGLRDNGGESLNAVDLTMVFVGGDDANWDPDEHLVIGGIFAQKITAAVLAGCEITVFDGDPNASGTQVSGSVAFGNYDDGYLDDNAPALTATDASDEAVGLKNDGLKTSSDAESYGKQIATPGKANDSGSGQLDFGDAPDPTYPTLYSNEGASHVVGDLFLGAAIDPEDDGQPHAEATGDDTDSDGDDEDGVVFTSPLNPADHTTVTVTASGAGKLSAWIDFNADGDWGDTGEQIFTDENLSQGTNNLSFDVPANAAVGATYARFRFSSAGQLGVTGQGDDGEVEDYKVVVEAASAGGGISSAVAELCHNEVDAGTTGEAFILFVKPAITSGQGFNTIQFAFPAAHNSWTNILVTSVKYDGNTLVPVSSPGDYTVDTQTAGQFKVQFTTVYGEEANNKVFEVGFAVDAPISEQSEGACIVTVFDSVGGDPVTASAGEVDANYGTELLSLTVNAATGGDGEILGLVLDENTNPIAGATVELWVKGQNGQWNNTQPDDHRIDDDKSVAGTGAYQFTGLADGDYYLMALADGFEPEWRDDANGNPDPANAVAVTITSGGTQDNINFSLAEAGPSHGLDPVEAAVAEVAPNEVDTGASGESFTLFMKPTITTGQGFQEFVFKFPQAHSGWGTVTVDAVHVGGVQQTIGTSCTVQTDQPGGFHVAFPNPFTESATGTIFQVDFSVDTPGTAQNAAACEVHVEALAASAGDASATGTTDSLAMTVNAPSAQLDFGDAPDPSYPTLLSNNGARHTLSALYLGSNVDNEADGQATAQSDGDDLNGDTPDDEDGVLFTTDLLVGNDAGVDITVTGANGKLNAWIDFNGNGDWGDTGEQIFADEPLAAGTNSLSFAVPAGATEGTTYARFRLSTQSGLSFDGTASDGEVEDYMIEISAPGGDGQILGLVLDENTNPIAGATVELWVKGPNGQWNNAQPDDHRLDDDMSVAGTGAYQFTGLEDGDYYLVALHDDFEPEWRDDANGNPESANAVAVTVTSGGTQDNINFSLAPKGPSGPAGRIISMFNENEDGFQLEFILEGELTGITAVAVNGPVGSGITAFALSENASEGLWEGVHPSESTFAGSVFDGDYVFVITGGDTPQVTVALPSGSWQSETAVITTPVQYPNVAWGAASGAVEYYVNVFQADGTTPVYGGEDSRSAQTGIDLSNINEVATAQDGDYKVQVVAVNSSGHEAYSMLADFTKGGGGSGQITGLVLDEGSNPIIGATVELWIAGQNNTWNDASGDDDRIDDDPSKVSDGHYVFGNLADGNYYLVALADGFEAEWRDDANGNPDAANAVAVTITGGGQVGNIDFSLKEAGPAHGLDPVESAIAEVAPNTVDTGVNDQSFTLYMKPNILAGQGFQKFAFKFPETHAGWGTISVATVTVDGAQQQPATDYSVLNDIAGGCELTFTNVHDVNSNGIVFKVDFTVPTPPSAQNAAACEVHVEPVNASAGDASASGASDSLDMTVTAGAGAAPVLASIGDQSVAENGTKEVGLSATDADSGQTLTFEKFSGPSWAAVSGSGSSDGQVSGSLTLTPGASTVGQYTIVVRVSDGTQHDEESITVTVTPAGAAAPVLASIGDQSVAADGTKEVALSATDADSGQTLTFTKFSGPTWAAVSGSGSSAGPVNGTLTLTPGAGDAGQYTVVVRVSDGTQHDEESITVTVTAGGAAPVLASIGAQSVAESGTKEVGLSATDADSGQTLTFTKFSGPSWAAVSGSGSSDGQVTGTLTLTPGTGDAGQYAVVVRVSDGTVHDEESVQVTVVGDSAAPVLASIGDQSVAESGTKEVGLSATDADSGQTLTFEKFSGPSWAAVSGSGSSDGPVNGSLTLTPGASTAGQYTIVVRVSDNLGLNDEESITVTVTTGAGAAPVLASIGDQSVAESGTKEVGLSATDADSGQTLTFEKFSGPSWAAVSGSGSSDGQVNGSLTLTPGASTAGQYTVVVRVSDGTQHDEESITVTVTAAGGVPHHLVWQLPPPSPVGVNEIWGPAEVKVVDEQDNVVTDYTDAVTLALVAGHGTGNLTGTSATPENGVATFDNVTYDDITTIWVEAASGTLVGVTHEVDVRATGPNLTGIVADDPDDGDTALSNSDTLTFTFNEATNQPLAGTKAEIDDLIHWGDKSLGTNYTGTWANNLTLVITVTDATDGNLAINDEIGIIMDGNADLMNAAETSAPSGAGAQVSGDWGSAAGGNADAALEVFIDAQHQETGTDVFPGETLHIKVTDNDSGANQNPLAAETVDVELEVVAGDSETLTLTESDVNTGVFIGSIEVKGQAFSADNGFIEALPGQTIGLTYIDPVAADDGINVPRTASSEVRSPVVVNEVMWMGSTPGGSGDEFIEIKNVDEGQVNVGDWVVEELGSSGNHFTIPSGTIIPADGFLLISKFDPDAQADNTIIPFMSDDPKVVQVVYAGMSLLNSGETLTVKDVNDNIMDQAAIGTGVAGDSGNKYSQERKESGAPGNWGYHAPGTAAANWHDCTGAKHLKLVYDDGGPAIAYDGATPGAPNSPETVGAADHLVWIMPPPSPVDEDTEWGAFAVGVQDEGDYILLDAVGQITIGEDGAGALGGTLTPNAQAGRALFTDVTYDTEETITVTADYSGLAQITQQVVVEATGGGAGVPHHLQWEQAPVEDAVQNVAIPDFSVGIYDDQNQLVSTATDQVSLSLKAGTGSIGGNTSNPAADGVASFTGISFDTVQTLTLEATVTDLLGVTREIVVQIPPPQLQSVVADDPDNGDEVFGNGDTITFTFSEATNQPPASNKTEIDGLLDFEQKVIGTNYTGTWSDAQTLVITIVDANSGNLAINDVGHIIIDGTDNLLNAAQTSAPCGDTEAMTGDWGQITATPAAYGDTKTGTIGAPDEKDYYTFTGTADDSVKIQFAATSGTLTAFAVLVDSGDNVLVSSGTGVLLHELTSAGTYRIVIRDQNNTETGDYEFTLQNLDNPVGATSVNFGDTVASVTVDDVTDMIPYSIGVEANDVVYVRFTELTTTAGTFDPLAQLYDAAGALIGGTSDGVLSEQATGSGTVYLVFSDTGRNGKGTFEFSLQRKNNPANVAAITYSATPVTGSIATVTQPKAYSFTGAADDNVHVTFEKTGDTIGTFVPSMYLYNAAGGILIHEDTGTLDHTLPYSGTYYLFISDKTREGAGGYSFVLDTAADVSASLEVFLKSDYTEAATDVFPGETLYIRVSDNDLSANTDSGAAETVGVTVEVGGWDVEAVILTETNVDTGVFQGTIPVAGSVSHTDGNSTMEVISGQTIVTTYIDPVESGGSTDISRTYQTPVEAPVVINEIMWMGSTADAADEWIEIKNLTDGIADVGEWTIAWLGTGSPGTITIPAGTQIPVDGYLLITNFDPTTEAGSTIVGDLSGDTKVVIKVNTAIDLLDGGEQLVLMDAASNIIDRANVAGSWFSGDGTEKISMERNELGSAGDWDYPGVGTDSENWHTATGATNLNLIHGGVLVNDGATPGAHNSLENPAAADHLVWILEPETPVDEDITWDIFAVGVQDNKNYLILNQTGQVTIGKTGGSGALSSTGGLARNIVAGRILYEDVTYDTGETITVTADYSGLTQITHQVQVDAVIPNVTAVMEVFLDDQFSDSAGDVHPGETFYIRVSDNDTNANADAGAAETIGVTVESVDEVETVTLTETGNNTGVFEGSIVTKGIATPSQQDGTLDVLPGNTVAFQYIDPFDSSDQADQPVGATTPVQSPVVINEIMWMGSDGSTADEWIEIKNRDDIPVDLSDWTVDGLAGGSAFTIPGDTPQVPVDGYMVIANNALNDANCILVDDFASQPVVVVSATAVSLGNTGQQLTLKKPDGNIMDQTDTGNYPAGNNATGAHFSMERAESGSGSGSWDYHGPGTNPSLWHDCTAAVNLDYHYDDGGSGALVTDGATPGAHNSPASAPAAASIDFLITPVTPVDKDATWDPFLLGVHDNKGYIILGQTGSSSVGKVSGAGAFTGTDTVNAQNGRVVFDNVAYDTAESITVTATYSGLSDAQTPSQIVVQQGGNPGVAHHLEWQLPPPSPVAVNEFWGPAEVKVVDDLGDIVTDYTTPVVLDLVDGHGSAPAISGTFSKPVVDGVSTFDDIKYSQVDTIWVEVKSGTLIGTTHEVDVKAAGPAVTGVVADDPDDGDTALSDGDTLTFTFDAATNTPTVNTKVLVDGLLDFGGNSLGTDYNGSWTDNQTLVITVINAAGGDLAITDTVDIIVDGDNDLLNQAADSAPVSGGFAVTGDWGATDMDASIQFYLDEGGGVYVPTTDVHPGETLYVLVEDDDSGANSDPGTAENVTVSLAATDIESVTLAESDVTIDGGSGNVTSTPASANDTGQFWGSIDVLGSGTAGTDGTLQVLGGEQVTGTYTDPQNSSGPNTDVTADVFVESPVVINEIMWMGSTVAAADEWIELKNLTDDNVDVAGWSIDGLGAGPITIESGAIPADGYMIITNFDPAVPGSTIVGDQLGTTVVIVDSNIDLADVGGQLVLKDAAIPTSNVIDTANASPWFKGDGSNLYSMERNEVGSPGDWQYPGAGTDIVNWHTCTSATNLQLMYDDQGSPAMIYDGATPGAHNSPESAPAADHLAWIMPPPTPAVQNDPWGPFAVAVQDNKNYIVLSQTGDVTIGKSDGTGNLASTGGLVRAVTAGRVLYDDVTYDTVETITVTADYSGLSQITESVQVKVAGPEVTGVEADDPTNVNLALSNGDFITISFAESTNAPPVDTKAAIDDLIDFKGKSLGADYTGAWTTTTNADDTLVITVVDATDGNLAINDPIFIMDDGNNDILNAAQTSAPVKGEFTLTGDWGMIENP